LRHDAERRPTDLTGPIFWRGRPAAPPANRVREALDLRSFDREAVMAEYDLIIRGGTIVDGTRTPRYISDIAIKNGVIAKIGGLKGASAARELDAAGRIVAPGFVDLHTHYDAQIFWD